MPASRRVAASRPSSVCLSPFRSVGPKTQALEDFSLLALQPSVNWPAEEYVLRRSYETLYTVRVSPSQAELLHGQRGHIYIMYAENVKTHQQLHHDLHSIF
jgi:hypothetical protein